jgi:hypothetical protein
MKTLPSLIPDYPKKPIRLTLDPMQSVGLWHLLDMHIDSFDELKNPTDLQKFAHVVYESIESMLSDRLDFRAPKAS